MTKYLQINRLVLFMGLVLLIHAQKSQPVYYFAKKYSKQRCNCKLPHDCSQSRKGPGTCAKCTNHFIGVTCQHFDFNSVKGTSHKNVPRLLRDGTDSTCSRSKKSRKAAIFQTDHSLHFIWIYINGVRDPDQSMPHLTLYNNNETLGIEFYFLKLNQHSFLIKLCKDVMYDKLQLSNLPTSTCSLEVSIGRNLANFSSPWIRYTYFNSKIFPLDVYKASDGGEDLWDSSLRLGFGEWWGTRLKHDAKVNQIRMMLHVANLSCWNYKVHMFASNGTVVRNVTGQLQKRVTITPATYTKIRELEVTFTSTSRTCTPVFVKEVYIYGEFLCPSGMYGVVCETRRPKGCGTALCDADWGCAKRCRHDWIGDRCTQKCRFRHGPNCEYPCSDQCANVGDCDPYTGDCIHGCKLGYHPPNCTKRCFPGTYGLNCSKTCTNCQPNGTTKIYACDHSSGICLLGCRLGYFGYRCLPVFQLDTIWTYHFVGFLGVLLVVWYTYKASWEEEEYTIEESADKTVQVQEEQELVVMEEADEELSEETSVSSTDSKNGHSGQSSESLNELSQENVTEDHVPLPEATSIAKLLHLTIGLNPKNVHEAPLSSAKHEHKEKVHHLPIELNPEYIQETPLSSVKHEPKEKIQQLPIDLNPQNIQESHLSSAKHEPQENTHHLPKKPIRQKVNRPQMSSAKHEVKEKVHHLPIELNSENIHEAPLSSEKHEPKEKIQQLPIKPIRGNINRPQMSSAKHEPKENIQQLPIELNPEHIHESQMPSTEHEPKEKSLQLPSKPIRKNVDAAHMSSAKHEPKENIQHLPN